ncbi:MAG: L,D-transpeptidase [Bacteroidetes bacterium]|nr:L,D-transpeptidase [Bacteroidota bacterium]
MPRLLFFAVCAAALALPVFNVARAQSPADALHGPSGAFADTSLVALFEPPHDTTDRPTVDDLYYLLRDARLFGSADDSRPMETLRRRTPIYRLGMRGGYTHVRLDDGREGYVEGFPMANVWVRVSKRESRLDLFRGADLIRSYRADFGYNPLSDKEQRGSTSDPDHWRTPEGTFTIVKRNPNSQYYRAFVLSYPTADHARRAFETGLISRRERDAIEQADRDGTMPPMNTALGGMIEIHGRGSGQGLNWTQGCVALRDEHMDELWNVLPEGVSVVIEQ